MILLHVEPGLAAAASLTAIKCLAWDHPGDERLTLRVGVRDLCLGPEWTYSGSPECLAALAEYGAVEPA